MTAICLVLVLLTLPWALDRPFLAALRLTAVAIVAAVVFLLHRWVDQQTSDVRLRELREADRLRETHFNKVGPPGTPTPRSKQERALFSLERLIESSQFERIFGSLAFAALFLMGAINQGPSARALAWTLPVAIALGYSATVINDRVQSMSLCGVIESEYHAPFQFLWSLAFASTGSDVAFRVAMSSLQPEWHPLTSAMLVAGLVLVAALTFVIAGYQLLNAILSVYCFAALAAIAVMQWPGWLFPNWSLNHPFRLGLGTSLSMAVAIAFGATPESFGNLFGVKNRKATAVVISGLIAASALAISVNHRMTQWNGLVRQACTLVTALTIAGLTRWLAHRLDDRSYSSGSFYSNEWGGNRNYYSNIYKDTIRRGRR